MIVIGREDADAVDCIDALRRGCDDYVERPFSYQELVERIRAVLRRTQPRDPEVVDAPPVRIDVRTRLACVEGRRLHLSQKEYELLLTLAREPDRVFTKAELLRDVWGYRVTARTRTLDSHASRLRRKLRECGASDGARRQRVGRRLSPARGAAGGLDDAQIVSRTTGW